MTSTERCVKSISRGNTLLRLTKTDVPTKDWSAANLYDYSVIAENTSTGDSVSVTYSHFTEANRAFRLANAKARGEADDLAALMNVDPSKGW